MKSGLGRSSPLSELSAAKLLLALGTCSMALAWLIPNHYPPWTSFYNEAAMGLALLALALATAVQRTPTRLPLSVWFVLAMAAIPLAQWFGGMLRYSSDAYVSSTYLVGVAIAIVVGHASGKPGRENLASAFSWAALAAAVLSSVFAISQSFELVSWGIWADYATPNMRSVGNLAQPNNFATLVGMGVIATLYLHERDKIDRIVAVGLAALLILAGALTQSRISLLFGPALIAACFLLKARKIELKTTVGAAFSLTALHWALMLALPFALSALFGEAPPTLGARGVDTPRYQMWRMLLDAVNLVPWHGYGWQQIAAAELAVVDRYPPIKEMWLGGHDVFIELIVTCGWPLGLLLSGSLLYWYVSRVRRLQSLEATVGMLVITIIGLHSLVELPYQFAYFIVPAGLWAGIVEREEECATAGSAAWMLIPGLAAMLIGINVAIEYPAVESDFRLVRFENARIGNIRATQPAPDAPLMSSLTAFLRFARTEPVAGMSAMQLESMKDSTTRYPYAASLMRYATALALNGQVDEGRRTFVKIRYLYGDVSYMRFKDDLHQRATQGQPELGALDLALPEAEAPAR